MAVGQNQWYHFGGSAPPILVYFSGDWDVHWGEYTSEQTEVFENQIPIGLVKRFSAGADFLPAGGTAAPSWRDAGGFSQNSLGPFQGRRGCKYLLVPFLPTEIKEKPPPLGLPMR